MKQLFHIMLISLALIFSACHKQYPKAKKPKRYKGAAKIKKKKQKKSDNYLESEAGKVIDHSEKRNPKEEKEKQETHKKDLKEEMQDADRAKKKKKYKKKNTGRFHFY